MQHMTKFLLALGIDDPDLMIAGCMGYAFDRVRDAGSFSEANQFLPLITELRLERDGRPATAVDPNSPRFGLLAKALEKHMPLPFSTALHRPVSEPAPTVRASFSFSLRKLAILVGVEEALLNELSGNNSAESHKRWLELYWLRFQQTSAFEDTSCGQTEFEALLNEFTGSIALKVYTFEQYYQHYQRSKGYFGPDGLLTSDTIEKVKTVIAQCRDYDEEMLQGVLRRTFGIHPIHQAAFYAVIPCR